METSVVIQLGDINPKTFNSGDNPIRMVLVKPYVQWISDFKPLLVHSQLTPSFVYI